MNKFIGIFIFLILSGNFLLSQDSLYVQVKNTKIQMIPPEHFEEGSDFNGFIHLGASATIAVTEASGRPYVYMGEVFELTDIEKQGATLISREDVETTSGDKGILYLISFNIDGHIFERLMLFTGDYNDTYIIMANYPQKIHHLIYDEMRTSLLSAKF